VVVGVRVGTVAGLGVVGEMVVAVGQAVVVGKEVLAAVVVGRVVMVVVVVVVREGVMLNQQMVLIAGMHLGLWQILMCYCCCRLREGCCWEGWW
jgi:hypothetical protein